MRNPRESTNLRRALSNAAVSLGDPVPDQTLRPGLKPVTAPVTPIQEAPHEIPEKVPDEAQHALPAPQPDQIAPDLDSFVATTPEPNREADPAPSAPPQTVRARNRTNWALWFGLLACAGVFVGSASLNANYAQTISQETGWVQWPVVGIFIAFDMAKPLFMNGAVARFQIGQVFVGLLMVCLAIPLAMLSFSASTTFVSASLMEGSQMNAQSDRQVAALATLQDQYDRHIAAAQIAQDARIVEESNGGCGPRCLRLVAEHERHMGAAEAMLNKIEARTDKAAEVSPRLARIVETHEWLNPTTLPAPLLLALFMALCIEVVAVFGPALLLRSPLPKRHEADSATTGHAYSAAVPAA